MTMSTSTRGLGHPVQKKERVSSTPNNFGMGRDLKSNQRQLNRSIPPGIPYGQEWTPGPGRRLLPSPTFVKTEGLKQAERITPTSLLRKEFRIKGTIAEPGQKDSISYITISREISRGKRLGYLDSEVIDAIIYAVSPKSKLRVLLETKPDITLDKIDRLLKAHLGNTTASDLYQLLSTLGQESGESTHAFVIRAMELRQKILFASQNATDDDIHYGERLVQKTFINTLETGIVNEAVRSKLRQILKEDVSDEEILTELSKAEASEKERNIKLGRRPTSAKVSMVNTDGVNDDAFKALQKQLQKIQNDVDVLKTSRDKTSRDNRPRYNNYLNYDGNKNNSTYIRKCERCTKENIDRCVHCWKCGNGTHFSRDCYATRTYDRTPAKHGKSEN